MARDRGFNWCIRKDFGLAGSADELKDLRKRTLRINADELFSAAGEYVLEEANCLRNVRGLRKVGGRQRDPGVALVVPARGPGAFLRAGCRPAQPRGLAWL